MLVGGLLKGNVEDNFSDSEDYSSDEEKKQKNNQKHINAPGSV